MTFDTNRRAFNSTFRPISKKRLAELAAGNHTETTIKPGRAWNSTLRPSRLRPMSKKTKQRIADYQAAAFAYWGERCFLCGLTPEHTKLDVHHIDGRKNGDNVMRMVPLCHRGCGCGAHNHNGMGDPRTAELNAEILAKMKGMGIND